MDYVECVRVESARFREAITAHSLELAVESCPGWNLRDLAHHLGEVQRWARISAQTGAPPASGAIDDPPSDGKDVAALNAWLTSGTDALCDVLASARPDDPTWHPFPVPKVMAVWPRRQAHEVTIHRWDAQHASGTADPFDPAFAVDFVREYFEVVVPRVVDRDGRTAPVGRLAVHLTDVGTELLVASTGASVALSDLDGQPVDGSMSGAVDDVLLALWQRQPLTSTDRLADEWLAFGGN